MLSFEQALDQLLSAARPVAETEVLPLAEAAGRVLAEDLHSTVAVPPLDNSYMDGYAVRTADVPQAGVRLPVSQRIAAGSVGSELAPGTVARIFTGAPIPPGADAVVMQEQCEADAAGGVIVSHVPQPGEFIRRAGEDIALGGLILPAGTRLRPQEISLAASAGLPRLRVHRRLRVATFFTGDELVQPGEPLPPGAIYNSNRYAIQALLQGLGCEVHDLGQVPDNLEATRAALRQAAEGSDLILTSGGVSVGEEDHVKPAVEAEGRLNMWRIAIKPGKPLAFGEILAAGADKVGGERQSWFIGMPGNPVSSFVTFLLFIRPFILRLQGAAEVLPRRLQMPAAFAWNKETPLCEFLRARIDVEGRIELFPNQSSGVMTSLCWGDGLAVKAPGRLIAPGDPVPFIPFSELLK